MTKIFGGFFHKISKEEPKSKESIKNDSQVPDKRTNDKDLKTTSQCQSSYGKALLGKQKNVENSGLTPEDIEKMSSEEKQSKLDKAGFTEDVIAKLKQKNDFYGPQLVDEALNMAIFLDAEFDAGTKITKNLIERTIDKFSPGASGGSAYCQRGILALTWNHGDEIYKAYGQKPPIRAKAIEQLSPEEKQAKLDKAGFTQDVIAKLKQKSTFYGPELVDEALNMAIYLDSEHEKGTKITKQLLDDVIDAFSPGASGGSAFTQMGMLAQTWTHGNEIKKAYK